MIDAQKTEDNIVGKALVADKYTAKYYRAQLRVTLLTEKPTAALTGSAAPASLQGPRENIRLTKYPKMKLRIFFGQIREWLSSSNTFKKIHEDASMLNDEKCHYLLQSMVEGSRAYAFVNSFPLTAENYPKAIQSLENCFGKNDLLVEFSVYESD